MMAPKGILQKKKRKKGRLPEWKEYCQKGDQNMVSLSETGWFQAWGGLEMAKMICEQPPNKKTISH